MNLSLDPITVEIVANALRSITDEIFVVFLSYTTTGTNTRYPKKQVRFR